MQGWTAVVLYTTLAGACVPLGAMLAMVPSLRPRWLERELRHGIIAFGAGVLLGAVTLTLVPEGRELLGSPVVVLAWFVAGGVVFFALERALGLRRREAPQFTGMLLDYLPEAIALGGLAAAGSAAVPQLALLVGLQNLPEGFNAFRELQAEGRRSRRATMALMLALVPIGPALGLAGYGLLGGHPAVLGAIMMLASGGILYLIFQDIAPQARLHRHWAPPLGAVLGFALALGGDLALAG